MIFVRFRKTTTVAKGPELLTDQIQGGKAGWRGARRKLIKPKMDLAKALAMMGFGSARIEDQTGKRNALDELNSALSRQMENIDKRKKKIEDTEKVEQRREAQHDKLRDEIRTMHEAYQFLAHKYKNDKARIADKSSDKKPSSELTDDMRNINDKEEHADEVFSMGAILSAQSAVSHFKDQMACKDEVKEDNTLQGSNLEQVS